FADDGYLLRLVVIGGSEVSPDLYERIDCLEVFWPNRVVVDSYAFGLVGWHGRSIRYDRHPAFVKTKRYELCQTCRLDAGEVSQAIGKLGIELLTLSLAVTLRADVDRCEEYIFAPEPQRYFFRVVQAFNEQPAADKQRERNGHL